jgi:hypothetical protein
VPTTTRRPVSTQWRCTSRVADADADDDGGGGSESDGGNSGVARLRVLST